MNHPVPTHQVPPHGQMQQNVSQQRQVPFQQQPLQQHQQQHQQQQQQLPKAAQTQQNSGQVSTYNPKLALYVLEKGKIYKEWDDVEAQYQHIPLQDLKDDLDKYRRKKNSVKAALQEITSATVRRLVNELVDQETKKLWEVNRTLQWKIASIETEWRAIKNGREKGREIKRVSVLLETEPSGFPDPLTIKPTVGGAQGVAKQNLNNMQGQQMPGNQNAHMAQQNKAQQQNHHPGQGQHFEQQQQQQQQQQRAQVHHGHSNTNAPPPPPPPPYQAHVTATPPPPPPPPGVVHAHQPAHPHVVHPQTGNMPGAYPNSAHGSRHGQPQIHVVDERFLRQNRPRRQGKHNASSSSEEESDWTTETGSVGSEKILGGTRNRDDRKLRGRGIKNDRTRRRSRSHVRETSRHRSLSRPKSRKNKTPARSISATRYRSTKKHRHVDGVDYTSDSKYHSSSSSHGSSGSRHGKHHRRRHSRDVSPSGVHFHTKRTSKSYKHHHRMSQDGSEASWRGSDTSSAPTSSGVMSTYAPGDRVFDERIRSHGHGRKHSYPHGFNGSSTPPRHFEDYNRHADTRYNDYPHQTAFSSRRDSHLDDEWNRPQLQRFSTMQTHAPNPFNTAQYPVESARYPNPSLRRAATYAPETHPYSEARYAERPMDQSGLDMNDIKDALLEVLQDKQRVAGPQRRFSAQPQRSIYGGGVHGAEDEWETQRRAPLGGARRHQEQY